MSEKKATTSEWIEIQNSKIHNKGIFAVKDIPKGTRVIEYVGEYVDKNQAEIISDKELEEAKSNPESHGAVYLFTLNKNYDVNGNVSWNTARLINHSCNPNCESDVIHGKVWIIATKNIKKGEELSYDYGYDLDNWYDHLCNCESKNCIGYITSQNNWINLRKKFRWQKKKKLRNNVLRSTH